MTQNAPAFWVRYRGVIDPVNFPLTTTYTYAGTFLASPNRVLLSATRVVLGPAQLTKQNFMEINWSPAPGLNGVTMSRGGTPFYNTNGAEGGFMDQGQYLRIGGGVTNT